MGEADNDPGRRVLEALTTLELAAVRHRHHVRTALQISEEELSALLYLARHGAITQSRLADITALSRSGANSMVQRLEQRGYLTRSSDAADRRVRVVELTTTGRNALAGEYRDVRTAIVEALDEDAGRDALVRVVREISNVVCAVREDDASAASPDDGGEPIWRHWA